ncbi:hypothetical protein D3C87_1735440 [compost metagenome]
MPALVPTITDLISSQICRWQISKSYEFTNVPSMVIPSVVVNIVPEVQIQAARLLFIHHEHSVAIGPTYW